jgi:hypothetical protein
VKILKCCSFRDIIPFESQAMFRRNMSPESSQRRQTRNKHGAGIELQAGCLPVLLFNHEDGGDMFLRNVGFFSTSYYRKYKVKFNIDHVLNEAPRHEDVWGSGGISPLFLTSAHTRGVARFTPRERAPVIHWIRVWCASDSVWTLWTTEKSPFGNRTSSIQGVTRLYTVWAVVAP